MPENFNKIRSYPERLLSWIPFSYWVSWILLWAAIYCVDLFISLNSTQTHSHITELAVAAFCASVSITLSLSSRVMSNLFYDFAPFVEEPNQKLEVWYAGKLEHMYKGYQPVFAGIAFAILVELTVGSIINSYNVQASQFLLYFRISYRMFGFFLLGLSLWATINFMRLPAQLLQFKFNLELSNLSGVGLQALGNAFLKLAFMGAISFFFLVCTILVSPVKENNAILIWAAIGAVIIFSLFLLPQLGIHRIMAKEKKKQLVLFSPHLQEAIAKALTAPTSDNIQHLKQLVELQEYLKSLNDWPFNMSAMWQLISALLIPLLLVILQIFFKV